MEILEQLARFRNAKRLRSRSPLQDFECRFAGIAVSRRDPMKIRVADLGGAQQRAVNHRPSNLQRPQISLRKRASG